MYSVCYTYIYTGCAIKKRIPWRNCDILTTVRHFCTIFARLIEDIFWHILTKLYCKILKNLKVMKFLRKISKFQINQAWKGKNRLLNSFSKLCGGFERADFYVMVMNANNYESRCSKCSPQLWYSLAVSFWTLGQSSQWTFEESRSR